MPKVVFDISLSVDGFMTAANQTPDEPMGPGGHVLHDWAFPLISFEPAVPRWWLAVPYSLPDPPARR
ncbi:MAG: hypothetical protein ACRDKF_12575 [Actinomycetota bacterium]